MLTGTELLNDAQKAAMTDTEGAVLVLAGAGSGKTRVLTHRVAYLVDEKGVNPYNILAITFTNKATDEMRERLDVLLGDRNKVWISTFHSLCAMILRQNAEGIGYGTNFSIYDESDSKRMLGKALREKHLDATALKDSIKNYISDAKNKGLSPEQYLAAIREDVNNADDIAAVYERYEELLKQSNAMDFDDLLHKTKELFETNPDVLERYQNRFKYIHVDEFQDTNGVQFDIVRMLAAKFGNIFVVGDDDQSIYGWRGAIIDNILNFDKLFPNVKVHKLLQNYRSTPNILEAANNVIKHNAARHEKQLFTDRQSGAKVEYFNAYNDHQEADWVADNIRSLKRLYDYSNRDFAILVRANSLSRIFESKLSGLNIKYRVLGGFKFFDRKEIQDVIAYMRIVNNPSDSEAIERVINFPRRGIGDTTIEKLGEYARAHGEDLIDVILKINDNNAVGGAAVKKLEEFRSLVCDLITNKNMPLFAFVKYLVERVNFEEAYTSTGKEEDETRWENIQEFLTHVKEYSNTNLQADISTFLQTVSLAPEKKEEVRDTDIITIATMHAVKGLEYKVVFIVGCEEDIFPSAQSIKEDKVEEERRVMYVAVTRARERLYISSTRQRFRFNSVQYMKESRFVDEAKGGQEKKLQQLTEKWKDYDSGRRVRNERYDDWGDDDYIAPKPRTLARETTAAARPAPIVTINKDTSGFVQGADVTHKVYGDGKIVLVTGSGADAVATILFPKLGVKKFVIACAPLKLK